MLVKPEQPATEHPGAEQPATEHPGAEQPATEHPGAEQPATEHPGAEHPQICRWDGVVPEFTVIPIYKITNGWICPLNGIGNHANIDCKLQTCNSGERLLEKGIPHFETCVATAYFAS